MINYKSLQRLAETHRDTVVRDRSRRMRSKYATFKNICLVSSLLRVKANPDQS